MCLGQGDESLYVFEQRKKIWHACIGILGQDHALGLFFFFLKDVLFILLFYLLWALVENTLFAFLNFIH